ncbi:hypothetical protein RND81_14G238600 [Saponaria officinalis]|uniref:Uncharacterized protein n=1 Tax=Saponaria officinalis TaxID=3572 RepID=A0AAW1GVS3_SAPOF
MASSRENSTQIKVITQCYVKPKYKVDTAKRVHFLGPVDLGFLPLDQMQNGLLYDNKPENMKFFLDNLKRSLSICLVDFYPLAGQFTVEKVPNEEASCVYVDCDKGRGVRIIHATAESIAVEDILCSIDVHKIVRFLFDFGVEGVNYDGHHRPLLSIQVTELLDGLFVGFTMNHSLGDGTSLWNFISTLSEIYVQLMEKQGNNLDDDNNTVVSRKPVFKPYFPDGCGPVLKLPYTDIEKSITLPDNRVKLRERIFHFSSKSISLLKAKANKECGVNNISSFQTLSAFIWRAITRARNLHPEVETCCALVINARLRFNPPFSNEYFGNFIVRQQSISKVVELLNNGLGWASLLVHQVVVAQNDSKIREFFENIVKFLCNKVQNGEDMSSPFYSPNLVLIGGSTRFDMYGPEFGLGKPVSVLNGYSGKEDGKINVCPGFEGGGSVDLEVCLKPETMIRLESDEEFMSFVS